jgi:choline dehydrogenase-like flavoprotein
MEAFAHEVGRTGLGRVQITFEDDGDPRNWPPSLEGGWHNMGTTRMSDDPKRGVVDRNCRLHGVSNLWIAGSSVFPTAGSGTPTMLLIALALRLAEHVTQRMA